MEEEYNNQELEIEGAGYSKNVGFEKAGLVHQAVKNCCNKRCVEMKPGYTTHIVDSMGNVFPKIISDARKEYIGAVIALTSLLSYEIRSYSNVNTKFEEFKTKQKEIKEKYIYKERYFVPKKDSNGNTMTDVKGSLIPQPVLVKGGREWLPEKSDLLPATYTDVKTNGNGKVTSKILLTKNAEGVWDYEINRYWDEIVELCDDWFAELNSLISDELDNYSSTIGM